MIDKTSFKLIILFIAVLVLDQATKYIALSSLTLGQPVPVLGDYLRWTLAYNPGGAFGMRLGGPNYYLITSLIVFVILLFYVIKNRKVSFISIPLAIVSGGAAGNIIDRFRFGEVVDFIDCEFPDISIASYHLDRWPIFNIADMAVSCGIIVTIILMMYHSKKAPAQSEDNSLSTPETM
ncbi:MAG: signal peptidase II [candidate division Zixibacteria bacterium]